MTVTNNENKEPEILENDHKIDSGFSDLVIMEVDGTWSTVGIQSHKALDLDKVSALAESPSRISILGTNCWYIIATNNQRRVCDCSMVQSSSMAATSSPRPR